MGEVRQAETERKLGDVFLSEGRKSDEGGKHIDLEVGRAEEKARSALLEYLWPDNLVDWVASRKG